MQPTDTRVQEFIHALAPRVAGDLRTDDYSRLLYSTDASIYQVMPPAVLIPKTVDDVQAAVECAIEYGLKLIPRTSGSSLAGQCVGDGLVIDFTRHLDAVLEINQEERWVRVQPGIVLDELNIRLKPYGLLFGPDPASSNRAAMGGIVANNSTGSHSIIYGMTADHVLETSVILADGATAHFAPLTHQQLNQAQERNGLEGKIYREIAALVAQNTEVIRAGTPRWWRRCGGYNLDRFITEGIHFHHAPDPRFNLAKLICGSEGTLGVMTEIKLNCEPLPVQAALAIVHFASIHDALTAVPVILETQPSAVELVDNLGLTLCWEVPVYARLLRKILDGTPNCILITEFYGETESQLQAKIAQLTAHLKAQGAKATAVRPQITAEQQADVWTVRKVALGLMMSVRGDHKPISFIEDAAVPVAHLAEYCQKIEDFCTAIGTQMSYYAHASAGCVHIQPLVNTKDAHEIAKMPQILDFTVDLLKGYGGSLSSEHGDGRARSWANERFFGPDLYRVYQQVKRIFDPQNILNPGNIVDPGPMTENLRFGEGYRVIEVNPHLDFSYEQGFDRAIEQCSGMGVCRKTTTGTMCPSFMVTREEEHSVRGRANALRAAMAGILPVQEFTSERMYGVMDLCIACKACKAECPSSVDMAKIKMEWLAHYHAVHGVPLRARLFADINRVSAWSSGWVAPLANWGLNNRLMRRVLARGLGISPERTLPRFARVPFVRWFRKRQPDGRGINSPATAAKSTEVDSPRRPVALFYDTFTNYNDPQIAIAATEVLEAAGFAVLLPGHRCCGRPMMSEGLLDKARAAARQTIEKLAPLAQQGIPIVGLEPSCVLSLRDEYLYLLPGHADVQRVAALTYTFEEFIAGLADEGVLGLQFTEEPRQVLLHGHCHQKALVGTGPSKRVLSLPKNYGVVEVDSGCCGMAGSFGYEAEHDDVSRQMAERRLLPAVRAQAAETLIVAAGVSCRQQIKHGTGRAALHPAEVLRAALAGKGEAVYS